jgi:hypothetical protein
LAFEVHLGGQFNLNNVDEPEAANNPRSSARAGALKVLVAQA